MPIGNTIGKRKQQIIAKNNRAENAKRIPHEYKAGDKVLLKIGTEYKYEAPYSGPHYISKVNSNGTVRLQMGPVTDTVNIRRIEPFQKKDSIHGGECSMRCSRRKRKRPE